MSMNPKISVVVVHYNELALTQLCLNSLKKQNSPLHELILVDNSLTQDARQLDTLGLNNLTCINEGINHGFARGCNLAISKSRGEYILILNNDLELDHDFLTGLTDAVRSSGPMIGMYAPKIFLSGTVGLLDSAGMRIYWDGLARQRGRLEDGEQAYNEQVEVLFPSGCAALYSRKMLDEIGLFDDDFFLYCEDTDLGLRAQLAGWKCLYVPSARAHHKYSASSQHFSASKAFHVERNRFFVVLKNYDIILLILSFAFTLKRWLYQLASIIKRKGMAGKFVERASFFELFLVTIKAYLSALTFLPKMLNKRVKNQKIRKISNRQFREIFKMHLLPLEDLVFKE